MKNYDNSLVEVREWKDKVYQDTKNLTAEEYIKKIRKDSDKLLSENSINLISIVSEKKPQRI